MTVQELNRDCITMLKQREICERDPGASWSMLADADAKITDEEIFTAYAGVGFSAEDFAC